jgi:hypothetical protein
MGDGVNLLFFVVHWRGSSHLGGIFAGLMNHKTEARALESGLAPVLMLWAAVEDQGIRD